MAKRLWIPFGWIATATLMPMALFLYLKLHPDHDPLYAMPHGHFTIVSGAALLAAAAAVSVGAAGIRIRNIHVTFLSLAFTSLALVFVLHGLATPGYGPSWSAIP